MRCGCPECGTFMVHEEGGSNISCVCPECMFRCSACLGTDSLITREDVERLRRGDIAERIRQLEADFAWPDTEIDPSDGLQGKETDSWITR